MSEIPTSVCIWTECLVCDFYNPAGWAPLAVASGFPLATLMIVVGILMLRASRKRDTIAPE
jgi:hypothetical protein